MGRFLLTFTIASATLFLGYKLWSQGNPRRAGFAAMQRKMMKRMMDMLPEDSPPKVVASTLPRLREQNDQILVLLKEQNDLLRQRSEERS